MDANMIAWSAGIFEGEGSIIIQKPRRGHAKFGVLLRVAMANEETIDRLLSMGYGKKLGPYNRVRDGKQTKPMWVWAIYQWSFAKDICVLWWPWLSVLCRCKVQKVLDLEPEEHKYNYSSECGRLLPGEITTRGQQWHKHRGEPLCKTCYDAKVLYNRRWKDKKKPERPRRSLRYTLEVRERE